MRRLRVAAVLLTVVAALSLGGVAGGQEPGDTGAPDTAATDTAATDTAATDTAATDVAAPEAESPAEPATSEAPPVSSPATDAEAEAIFELFNHRRHEGVLADQGIFCTSCHQVGASGDPRISMPRLESWVEPPPQGACHFCHNPSDGSPPTGIARCILCHDTMKPPPSHGAGWIDLHGTEARLATWSCDSCHRRSFCIDCHERKEAARYNVHDRAWLTVHGIAARSNPTECGTCHLQTDCISCHSTTSGRLR